MSFPRCLLLMGIKKAYHQGNVGAASGDHSKQMSVVVLRAFRELVWTKALQAATAQQSHIFSGSTKPQRELSVCSQSRLCIAEDNKVWCRSEFWKL